MSDTPTPAGSTPSPNQADIDAALAAAGAPASATQASEQIAAPASSSVEAGALASDAADVSASISNTAEAGPEPSAAGVAAESGRVVVAPPLTSAAQGTNKKPEYDETAAAIAAALAEEQAQAQAQAHAAAMAPPPGSMPLELPDFGRRGVPGEETRGVDLLNDVDLNVKIELGRAEMSIDEVLRLGSGAVVELDKLAGDPVDVLVNDRLVARGEVLILNDNFCVRISEILTGEEAEVSA